MSHRPLHPHATHPVRDAVVLLSGGLDSATVLAVAREAGHACHALSFDYGQRHRVELTAAADLALALGAASHRTVTLDLRAFGGSALTDDALDVPKDREEAGMSAPGSIPITYVPARNTIFLSYALAMAEVLGSTDLYLGVNAVDYSGYPDCRPQYIAAFETMANLATRAGVEHDTPGHHALKIHTPLIDLSKTDIIALGLRLGVDFSLTHSCYDPVVPPPDFHAGQPVANIPCGHCDACLLRIRAFDKLGQRDPAMLRWHGEDWQR